MSDHPIEALLRPAVELRVAGVAAGAAIVSAIGSEYFMMTPTVGQGAAVVFAGFSAWWLKKGMFIVRYQRNLKKLAVYEMDMKDVPVSKEWLFIGRGFEWEELHTQRLHDTRRSKFKKFVAPSELKQWIRKREKRWEGEFLYKVVRSDSRLNPFRPLPDGGGSPVLHGVELKEHDIHVALADANGHLLVLGTTRVGKTRAAEILISQDIHRGDIVIVIDPKGDADLLRRVYVEAKRAGRGDDFYMFHLGFPDLSARYNSVGSFNRLTEIASKLSGQLEGTGDSAVFKEFAWRFTNIVARAVTALGQIPNFRIILRHIQNVDALFLEYADFYFREDEEALEEISSIEAHVKDKDVMRQLQGRSRRLIAFEKYMAMTGKGDDVIAGLRSAFMYEKSYFDKIVASLLPLLEKLTSGKIADLLSPDYYDIEDKRPIFDWPKIVNQKGIVYIGLDALTDPDVAAAVGNTFLADLVSYAGERYKHGTTSGLRDGAKNVPSVIKLHADEVNSLMGDEFVPMVNKAGGADIHVTAYTQTLPDIEVKLGSSAKAKQVVGNFNNILMFRVRESTTAELITDHLPSVKVNDLTLISGYHDTSDPESDIDFTSGYEDRIGTDTVALIEPHDVMNLPKGQAFALVDGGRLKKIRMPLPKKEINMDMPDGMEDMAKIMLKNYRTGSTWWYGTSSSGEIS